MKKGDIVAFSLLAVCFLALICQIIVDSAPNAQVNVINVENSSYTSSIDDITSSQVYHVGLININTANVDLLMQLDRIGEVKAKAIIEYRENNGPFSKKEDIMNVYGIGEGIFKAIENFIEV